MALTTRQIIDAVNASFARNDLEGFLARCADEVEWVMVGDTTKQGKAAIREWMGKNMPKEAPRVTVNAIVAEGDYGVSYGDMTMKEEENGPDVPYSYCDVYRFRNAKIVLLRSYVIKAATAAV